MMYFIITIVDTIIAYFECMSSKYTWSGTHFLVAVVFVVVVVVDFVLVVKLASARMVIGYCFQDLFLACFLCFWFLLLLMLCWLMLLLLAR